MKDKTVLISGGTSGLGLATAKAFIAKGATVIIASRTRSKFETNLGKTNEKLIFIETDFKDMTSVQALYDTILKTHPNTLNKKKFKYKADSGSVFKSLFIYAGFRITCSLGQSSGRI